MGEVISLKRNKCFTLEEANETLSIILKLSEEASRQTQDLIEKLDIENRKPNPDGTSYEEQINAIIAAWQNKVEKLGALPRGLWLADFDAGDGYYCWKYPEPRIEHWHRYHEGYTKRVPLSMKLGAKVPSKMQQHMTDDTL